MTEKQETFAKAYARTDDAPYAAWCAGLGAPESTGYRMLKVPSVADAIEKRRMSDCILLESSPEVASITIARLTGKPDYAGRRYDLPSHEQHAKLLAPYEKAKEAALQNLTISSRDASEIDGSGLLAKLHEIVDSGVAEIAKIEAAMAARAKPVAPIEIDETDVFG